ncbi:MAG: hypothetical protein KDA96_15080 [Planctomycetaceae bacterium]|nr:hypothetical protein [Planctomycetaceae bacterium]
MVLNVLRFLICPAVASFILFGSSSPEVLSVPEAAQIVGGTCFAIHEMPCEGEESECDKEVCEWQDVVGVTRDGWVCSADTIRATKGAYMTAIPANPGDSGRDGIAPDGLHYCVEIQDCIGGTACELNTEERICETTIVDIGGIEVTIQFPCTVHLCSIRASIEDDPRSKFVLDAENSDECTVPQPPNPLGTNTQVNIP